MRTIAITVLSVALAGAIVSGVILYQEYREAEDSLMMIEKKAADLKVLVTQLDRETSSLRDQLKGSAQKVKELEGVQTHITELERAIVMKDQTLSQSHETIRAIQKDLEEERKANEKLETKLASRDALVAELQEHLEGLQSEIRSLQEGIARGHTEIKDLTLELTALEEQKATYKREMAQLQSTYEANLSHHIKELEGAQAHISELENALDLKEQTISRYEDTIRTLQERYQYAQSRIHSLEEKLKGSTGRVHALKGEKALAETKIDQVRSTYETLISDLEQQIEKQEVSIKRFEDEISVTFVDRILFEFGRAAISPEGEEVLQKVGKTLKEIQGKKIRVVGHTDNRPIYPDYHYKFPSNWELSAARASAVVRHLHREIGLDPRNLEAVGRSFYNPIATNATPEGRAQNRRVEIIIAPQLE